MGPEFYPFLLPLLALFLGLNAAGVPVVGDVPAGLPRLRWPTAALGGVLIVAAIGLFDVASLRRLWRVSRAEFSVAIVTMLGVIALDVLQGILLAVAVALLLLLKRSARPTDAVVGRVPGMKGFHDLAHHPDATTTPELLLYRFETRMLLERTGVTAIIGSDSVYATLKVAMEAFQAGQLAMPTGAEATGDMRADAFGEESEIE